MDDAGKLARSGQKQMEGALAAVNRVILGKDHEIRLAFACLLARGHLLIEDIPGVGRAKWRHRDEPQRGYIHLHDHRREGLQHDDERDDHRTCRIVERVAVFAS